jgi:3-deoxy-D-manno-octulosonic-acid transferase
VSIVYDIAYLLLLILAAPWLGLQSLRTGKYRQGWRQKLLGSVARRSSYQKCIWFHAVSVGEVNLLVQMVERWKLLHPDWEVVVTSTTRTGYALAEQRFSDSIVDYCPLDFSWATRRAFQRFRPDLLVMAELELWPNMIGAAQRSGVPVAVINGRLSESSFRGYQKIRRLALSPIRTRIVFGSSAPKPSVFRAPGVSNSIELSSIGRILEPPP